VDTLLYAFPVCAPYETLRDYKFKVKVIPGNEKKGKAVKTCLETFLKTGDITDKEKDLIKAIPDSDWNLTLISECKIAAAGILAQKTNQKKKKRKN